MPSRQLYRQIQAANIVIIRQRLSGTQANTPKKPVSQYWLNRTNKLLLKRQTLGVTSFDGYKCVDDLMCEYFFSEVLTGLTVLTVLGRVFGETFRIDSDFNLRVILQ